MYVCMYGHVCLGTSDFDKQIVSLCVYYHTYIHITYIMHIFQAPSEGHMCLRTERNRSSVCVYTYIHAYIHALCIYSRLQVKVICASGLKETDRQFVCSDAYCEVKMQDAQFLTLGVRAKSSDCSVSATMYVCMCVCVCVCVCVCTFT